MKINVWQQTTASRKITPYYSVHLFGRTFTECLQALINYKEEETQEMKTHFPQDKRVVPEKTTICFRSYKFQHFLSGLCIHTSGTLFPIRR